MALTSTFGYTNTTRSEHEITPYNIDLSSDYAVTTDDPMKVVLKNVTSPIDQIETITFQAQELNSLNQEEKNANPPKVAGGRLVTVKIEDKKRVTSSLSDTDISDYPASVSISFRFAKTQYVTAADLAELLERNLGAIQSSDGQYILDKLMMLKLNPNT